MLLWVSTGTTSLENKMKVASEADLCTPNEPVLLFKRADTFGEGVRENWTRIDHWGPH